MKDWNGKDIEIMRSSGGVIATKNPFDNLIKTEMHPFPPPEIVQKLYESIQKRAFAEEVKSTTSIYSDLQSINSEDAMTWSVFGPLIYGPVDVRLNYYSEFLSLLNLEDREQKNVNIWLWRRIPHPEKHVPGGPEVDFGIQSSRLVILGEAKWKSPIGRKQGKNQDKDQIQLRSEFIEKYGKRFWPEVENFIILGVSLETGMLEEKVSGDIIQKNLTWNQICSIKSHPLNSELLRYYGWKMNPERTV